jgi:hypothetical protein
VDTQGNGERFTAGGFEAKYSGGTAATHKEHMLTVQLRPGAAVGIVLAGLLDNHEGMAGAVANTGMNSVGHCNTASVSMLLEDALCG